MIEQINKIEKSASQGKMSGFLKIILWTLFISMVSTASAGMIKDGGTVHLSDGIMKPYSSEFGVTQISKSLFIAQLLSEYIPPVPVNFQSTQGNFWVSYTWQAGPGILTDSYNVSHNGLWNNGSSLAYLNNSVGAHGWSNITVWAYNNSGGLSLSSVSLSTQVRNNKPVLNHIGDRKIVEGELLQFTVIASDADSDKLSFGTDAIGILNLRSGAYSWQTEVGDAKKYTLSFKARDNYGGVDTEKIKVTVKEVNSVLKSIDVTPANTLTGTQIININGGKTKTLSAETNGPYKGTATIPINFKGSASGGTSPYRYSWEFGDGEKSNLQNPIYTYSSAGEYNANFTVTDTDETSEKDSTTVYVDPLPVLTTIKVSPETAKLVEGETQVFKAAPKDQNGDHIDAKITWTSSDTTVGTVDEDGLFTALAPGTTMVNAINGLVTGNAVVIVTSPKLISIELTPVNPTINLGQTQQFTATGTYSDSTIKDLTATATWLSGNPEIATIATGLATSKAAGTTDITASIDGITSPVQKLTVTDVKLVSIALTPENPTIAVGETKQFTAIGTYSDSTTKDLTATATWLSGNPEIATIAAGLATSKAAGTTDITASIDGITSLVQKLTVTDAKLVSIALAPVNPNISVGETKQFTATGTYSDSTTKDLTATATWLSGNPEIASIAAGLATSKAAGTTDITASIDGITSPVQKLTVTDAKLVSIALAPVNPNISVGETKQFTATGTYSDSTTKDLTATATWLSSNTEIATIAAGLATSKAAGTTDITASIDGITSPVQTLTVTDVKLVSIALSPVNPTINIGQSQQFIANGTYSDGSKKNITSIAIWSSKNKSVATINSDGLAMSVASGITKINATRGEISSPDQILTVNSANIVSIALTPVNPTINIGQTQQFIAKGTYSDGSIKNITFTATWSSSNTTVGSVDSATGNFTAKTAGTTKVNATNGSVIGTAVVTVPSAPPAPVLKTITVSPPMANLAVGGTQVFTAAPKDQNGNSINVTITWSSSNPTVGTIITSGTNGNFTAKAAGTTIIRASNGLVNGTATVTVTAAPITPITPITPPINPITPPTTPRLTSIIVSSPTTPLAVGGTHQFTAIKKDQNGNIINATVAWSSSNMTVGIIDATGTFTAKGPGSTSVNATNGLVKGTANVVVKHAPSSDPNGTYRGLEGIPVSFNGSKSNDSDGNIVSYFWDFGDGTNGTGVNSTHTYNQSGNYTVSLKVTDNDGLNASNSTTAKIEKPLIRITSPTDGQKFWTSSIEVKGTALSNASRVEVKVGNGPWENASGTNLWNITVKLSEGQNTIWARAIYSTINSEEISITVTYAIPYNSDGGGGGTTSSGGGGGGSSGENTYSIELIEKYDLEISKDKTTSYWFRHLKNPIMYINITGNTNMGIITTTTELLKYTSTFVNNPPKGLVYKNINIWVGTSGVATPRNIKEALIKFRVDNTWMSSNGVKGSDIVLVKWNGTDWIQLETMELSRDDTYTFFQGKTNAFSPFAITTNVDGARSSFTFADREVPIESGGIMPNNDVIPPAQTAIITQTTSSGTSTWSIILIVFVIGIIAIAFYFVRVKK